MGDVPSYDLPLQLTCFSLSQSDIAHSPSQLNSLNGWGYVFDDRAADTTS